MSLLALLNACELGALYGVVAVAVYLSFRILDFPDLTVDGSFTTGAATAAALISNGTDPWVASLCAIIVGVVCGLVTALLNRRFGMLHLLAGILTTIALYSVDLRIMGRPNIPLMNDDIVLTRFLDIGYSEPVVRAVAAGLIALVAAALIAAFLLSEHGLGMRATGANPRMARANGVDVDRNVYIGLGISNGLVGFAGALFAQFSGFADIGVGTGTIIFGLASVILGESLFPTRRILIALIACIVGSVLYRIAVSVALNVQFLGLRSSDLQLVTATLVVVAFVVSKRRASWRERAQRKRSTHARKFAATGVEEASK